MSELSLEEQLNNARLLLECMESEGGKIFLDIIDSTIKAIPTDVSDYFGTSVDGMKMDTTRMAFSAGGKVYLQEVLRRVDEVREFVKREAEKQVAQK